MSEQTLEKPPISHRRGLSSDFRQPRDLTLSKRLLLVKFVDAFFRHLLVVPLSGFACFLIPLVPPDIREWLRPELHLDGLDLTELPSDVSYLVHLEEISMRDNKLEMLPESFAQLSNLKVRVGLRFSSLREVRKPLRFWL